MSYKTRRRKRNIRRNMKKARAANKRIDRVLRSSRERGGVVRDLDADALDYHSVVLGGFVSVRPLLPSGRIGPSR